MKHPLAAAVVALALAGCGGAERSETGPVPPRAGTTDFMPLTMAQAARKAQRVALVQARGSRVVEPAPGMPFTRTTFAVERVLKGRLPHRFVLQVIGGRVGDEFVRSPVQPFAARHRYVLFLGPDGPAGPTIFPQAVIEVKGSGVPAEIRRALR